MLQKLLHKKWMFASLLIGNILLISISCSYPMYKNASLQRILTKSFNNYLQEKNTYPFTLGLHSSINKAQTNADKFIDNRQFYDTVADQFDIPVIQRLYSYNTVDYSARSLMERDDKASEQQLKLSCLSEMEAHIEIISGKMYSDKVQADGVIEAIVTQNTFNKCNLIVGEEYEFTNLYDGSNNPVRIRITGVFRNSKTQDNYWVNAVDSYHNECFISSRIFEDYFIKNRSCSIKTDWYVLMDYTKVKPNQVPGIINTTRQLPKQFEGTVYSDYLKLLKDFEQRAKKISNTLMILQVPVLVLLCSFIFMISGQMLDMEQNEIALLKSRGSGKGQLIMIYLYQSIFVALISLIAALPIGVFLCKALGSANAFLEFVQRSTLEAQIDKEAIVYCIGAVLVSIGVMVLPVYKHADVSIVGYKQKKSRKSKKLWQRFYLDFVLLSISLYGLYSFSSQKNLLITKVLTNDPLDPLLYLSSSLFIIGASLLALRIQPLLVWIIFRLGRKRWKPASYATFLQVLRTGYKQNFIMVFFMFTIALGIFNAAIARTILTNADNNLQYSKGADIVLEENWANNEDQHRQHPEVELVYVEPDYEKYQKMVGAASITRVIKDNKVKVSLIKGNVGSTVLGINTKEFGETSWFMDGLLPGNYFSYLNALAANPKAVLLSSNFKSSYSIKLGDPITYYNAEGSSFEGIVYGFVDYWPSYKPKTTVLKENGTTETTDNFLIIADFATVQEAFGVRPYQVWIKADNSADFIYDFVKKHNISFAEFTDTLEEMKEIRNDTIFQGTSGILTMSFIIILLLSSIGFLIYWILSIKSRELLFGVLRAMGMAKKEIIRMLFYEQIFSTGLSLAAGTLIGILASKLFVPLIQIAYSAADQVLPLQLITEKNDMVRLFAIILAVMVICMIILGKLISKIKISQALKLGED